MRQLKINPDLKTNRGVAGVDEYLNDISKSKPLSIEREVELAQLIKQDNKEALHELVTANLRFAVSVAKQYQYRGVGLMDLINSANEGMIIAAERFDETRGFKFISYAVWWIRQSIMQSIANHSKIVRRNTVINELTFKIETARYNYFTEHGEFPSDYYVYDLLELTENEINRAKLAESTRNVSSINMKIGFDNDEEMVNFIEQDMFNSSDHLTYENDNTLIINSALKCLDEREKKIIVHTYGLNDAEQLDYTKLGDMMKLTRERVRQIHNVAIEKLQEKTNLKEMIC